MAFFFFSSSIGWNPAFPNYRSGRHTRGPLPTSNRSRGDSTVSPFRLGPIGRRGDPISMADDVAGHRRLVEAYKEAEAEAEEAEWRQEADW